MQQTTQARYAFSQAIVLQKKVLVEVSRPENYAVTHKFDEEDRNLMATRKATELSALGDYYAGAGDSERAKQSYLQAIREDPDKQGCDLALTGLAGVCIKGNDVGGAFTTVYNGMVLGQRQNPEAAAWYILSTAYANAGKDGASDWCFRKAMSLGSRR